MAEEKQERILPDGSTADWADPFTPRRDAQGRVYLGELLVKGEEPNALTDPLPAVADDSIEIDGEKLTREELAGRLKAARELKEREEEVDAIGTVLRTPWFQEAYERGIAEGAFEAPLRPQDTEADVATYHRLSQEPEFRTVQRMMAQYADTLPPWEAELIATSHKKFCEVYGKIKASYGGPIPVPKPEVSPVTDIVARLRAKEVAKGQAITERAGVENPEADAAGEKTARAKQIAKLEKAARGGDRDAVAAYIAESVFGGGRA